MANENYVSRPKTKPSSSMKGKLNEWDNGYKEFVPAGTRESNRTMFKQLGGSSFYKSEGTKESSYSVHVNVDGNCADPVNEAFEVFKALTAGQAKQPPKMPGSEGRMLFDDNNSLQVWLDTAQHEVVIQTRLQCSAQIERQLLQAQAQMNVTLGRYRTEILKNEK